MVGVGAADEVLQGVVGAVGGLAVQVEGSGGGEFAEAEAGPGGVVDASGLQADGERGEGFAGGDGRGEWADGSGCWWFGGDFGEVGDGVAGEGFERAGVGGPVGAVLLGEGAGAAGHSGGGVVQQEDVQAAGAVGAEFEDLFDVGGAGRAGDEHDRSRHEVFLFVAEEIPGVFHGREDVAGAEQDDDGFGQQVDGLRASGGGGQDDCSSFCQGCPSMLDADGIVAGGGAFAQGQERGGGPGDGAEVGVGGDDRSGRQVLGGEVGGDGGGGVLRGGDAS